MQIYRRCRPAAASILFLLAASAPVAAQSPPRSAEREARIERSLEAVSPAAVPIFRNATAAFDRGEYPAAAAQYLAVLELAPDFSPATRRVGMALIEAGKPDEGVRLLERAVEIERTPENLISLARALANVAGSHEGPQPSRVRALAYAKEAAAKYQGGDDPSYLSLTGHIALTLGRESDFRDVAARMRREYPGDVWTHYYEAVRAAADGEWSLADREIRTAGALGLPAAAVEGFLAAGVRRQLMVRRLVRYGGYLMVAWAAGLGLLFLAGKFLSGATLKSIGAAADAAATSRELTIRTVYRKLITVAATYYYVSLPFVIVAVVAGTALFIYLFLLLGRIPVVLVLSAVLGALITVFKMIQSLFIRVDATDPGRTLNPSEAPALWNLVRQVAETVGTRPVDEIRVTPGTDMAVYERGTARERARDEARRILVIGVGLLQDFSQAAFCAVLAHEYGHFSHRDTAGGDVAMRVQNDMIKFAGAMVQHGQAVWWNLAFQFLRLYAFLFRRISHGATRLQEVLADRVAAIHYGARHFEEGLRHVVRRHVEFGFAANQEMTEAVRASRPMRNLYDLRVAPSEQLEQEVHDALARPSSEDDTHPGPYERFELVNRVVSQRTAIVTGAVWDLFANREALAAEMTAIVDAQLRSMVPPLESAPEPV